MKGSFKILTVLGIPIEINASWFIILGLVIFTLSKGYFPLQTPGLSTLSYWIMGLITSCFLFVCLLLHELSHSIVAKRNKLPISGITLFVFGGVAHMEKEPGSPAVEFKMAIAGPLMSIFLALIFGLFQIINLKFQIAPAVLAVTDYLSFLNLAIAIFNMIPGFPLDGGRVFRALLWHFTKNYRTATYIASLLGKTFAVFLMALGLVSLITGNAVSGMWFIFLGFFLLEAAEVSYRQVIMKRALTGFRIKDIMSKNVIFVPAETNIHDLMDNYFFKYRHNCFPIVKSSAVIGFVTFHDAKETPKEYWESTKVENILIPINESLIIKENTRVVDALGQMAHNGLGRLLVLEKDQLAGIVSQKDIMKLFRFREEAAER